MNIARGTTLVAEPGDTVLFRSLGAPMAVLREQEYSTIAIGFDPRQSDIALRVAFPLLVDNILRYVEQRDPGFVASVQIGQSRELALSQLGLDSDGVTRVRITAPTGESVDLPVQRGRFRLRAVTPGFYGITALDGGSAGASIELAVNQAIIDASDLHSRLEDAAIDETAATAAPPEPAPIGDGPLWSMLLVVVAGIIALEWATYHRRVTV